MPAKWVLVSLIAGGFVLDVLGLFLPWGEWTWWRPVLGDWSQVLGINNSLGMTSLAGMLFAGFFWSLYVVRMRKHRSLKMFAVVGGVVIMMSSFAWIVSPGAGSNVVSSTVYTASYGAYVSFAGGALTFAGAILAL